MKVLRAFNIEKIPDVIPRRGGLQDAKPTIDNIVSRDLPARGPHRIGAHVKGINLRVWRNFPRMRESRFRRGVRRVVSRQPFEEGLNDATIRLARRGSW